MFAKKVVPLHANMAEGVRMLSHGMKFASP